MFQRLARNFIKNGYFPTDAETIERVLGALDVDAKSGQALYLLDPCCGEGTALAEVAGHLQARLPAEVGCRSYGVEYDEDRAYHAKTLLGDVLHSDLLDSVIAPRRFGLLWLNPPYGDLVADAGHFYEGTGRQRLEKQFYQRTIGTLQFGGVLVLIIPHHVIDSVFAGWLSRHLTDVRVYRAATERFKQVVILGVKQRADAVDTALRHRLEAIGRGDVQAPELPTAWAEVAYPVPTGPTEPLRFYTVRLDARQLAEVADVEDGGLWPRFETVFQAGVSPHRRPLCAMSNWHLALALAAGQIAGIVTSDDGQRRFLVSGDTHKTRDVREEVQGEGEQARLVRTCTDRFVPVIRAIDLTPDAASFGNIVTIQ